MTAPQAPSARPTTWADCATGSNRVEQRQYRVLGTTPRANGRTYDRMACPFCNTLLEASVWSLHGGGKRCTERTCRAILGKYGEAYRLVDELRHPPRAKARRT